MGATRHIVVVEESAHLRTGHFPILFADTAHALTELGLGVTVLTTAGWALQNPAHQPPFEVRRLSPVARALHRFGRWVGRRRPSRLTGRVQLMLCDAAVVRCAGRLARRLDADVLFMTMRRRPFIPLLVANSRRWIVLQFFRCSPQVRATAEQPVIRRLIQRREQQRRRRGGGVILVMNSDASLESWRDVLPGIEMQRLAVAGARPAEQRTGSALRDELDPATRIALLFGAAHSKDLETVFAVFAGWEHHDLHPEWHLFTAGECGEAAQRWQAERGLNLRRTHVFTGFASDELRSDLYAAANAVVLSFRPGWGLDSGTLTDAITWSTPIVCSSPSAPAEIAESLGIGVVFDSGSAASLEQALLTAPSEIPAPVWAAAQQQYGMRAVARRYVEVFDSIGE